MNKDTFDKLRNLAQHKINLGDKISAGKIPQGNCLLCANVACLTNITSKAVLDKLGLTVLTGFDDIPDIKQYTCDDSETDPSVPTDLRG